MKLRHLFDDSLLRPVERLCPMRTFLAAVFLCMSVASPVAEARLVRELQVPSARRIAATTLRARRAAALRVQRITALARKRQRVSLQPVQSTVAGQKLTPRVPVIEIPSRPSFSSSSSPVKPKLPLVIRPLDRPVSIDAVRQEVLRLTNKEREKAGLSVLVTHGLLQQVADAYAMDMATRDFFAHRDPDGDSSVDRIRAIGYLDEPCDCTWSYATGENIAKGQKTAAEVVKDWMNSPAHRENILNPRYTQIGIGFYDGYWTQEFGNVSVDSTGR